MKWNEIDYGKLRRKLGLKLGSIDGYVLCEKCGTLFRADIVSKIEDYCAGTAAYRHLCPKGCKMPKGYRQAEDQARAMWPPMNDRRFRRSLRYRGIDPNSSGNNAAVEDYRVEFQGKHQEEFEEHVMSQMIVWLDSWVEENCQ